MPSNSSGGAYEILGRDLARPENRYLSVPLIRLITSGRLPKEGFFSGPVEVWSEPKSPYASLDGEEEGGA